MSSSIVWNFATKRKNPLTKQVEAQCNRCNKVISCPGGSTTGIAYHLKTHGIDLSKADGDNNSTSSSESKNKLQKTIECHLERKSLKEILSDLATDGITIRAITKNAFIRASISREGYKLPKGETAVMKLILEDYEDKKRNMVNMIEKKLSEGCKFSMSIDEYTTVRRRRYFGINLHEGGGKNTLKTGIVRIFGSCDALKMVEAVKDHLNTFGICLKKDIVGSTQDGAAVNKKFIKNAEVLGQFCFNHAIHLAVCDTLYAKNKILDSKFSESEEIDGEENDEYDDAADLEFIDFETEEEEINHHDILKNVRKLAKYFRSSPTRNHVLQSKVKESFGKEIDLHLDVKTRWNSIPAMLSPIIKIENEIRASLEELNKTELVDQINFEELKNLQMVLEPVKLAVENLSRENVTLINSETILNFMLEKLDNLESEIGERLAGNLRKRIDERNNPILMELLQSLKDPKFPPSKTVINFAGDLASRLFGIEEESLSAAANSNVVSTSNIPILSMQEELNLLLQKDETENFAVGNDKFKWLKTEFVLFKNSGQRTENLQKIYNSLLSIRPTSTDVERVFSICTSFCTKIRSRLSDKSLNALVFLKYYYKKK